jgi:hypothetical protein
VTKAERKRLVDAMCVETNPQRKLAFQVVLGLLPFDVVLPHSAQLSRHVASIFGTMGADVNRRDLMLLNAWRAALSATIKMNCRGQGVEISEFIAGPTFATVRQELKRLYPNRNISSIADSSLRRSLKRLKRPCRKDKPGPKASGK